MIKRNRILKRTLFLVLLLAFLPLSFITASAEEYARDVTAGCEISGFDGKSAVDGSLASFERVENTQIKITAPCEIGGVYVRYRSTPKLKDADGSVHEDILASFIDLSQSSTSDFTIDFQEAEICELSVYSKGQVPKDVQKWKREVGDTDVLLLATHSDDDQLFFAGLLPYYARHEDIRVRVAYFVSHRDAPSRLHELLSGLWECGVEYYPEIGIFPDAYSESLNGAINNLRTSGYTYDDVTDYQRYLLEKYRPKVVVLHDFAGEYSHGQHIVNTKSFCDTLESAKDGQYVPEKVYVHLYGEKEIKLPIDEPIEEFDGLSAFNVSQRAFMHHKSQHWTWFYRWIYGSAGNISRASQIRSYNPALYGLYFTRVGEDIEKNDILENITPYSVIEREAKERAEREQRELLEKKHKEEQARLEAEKQRQAEAERIAFENERRVRMTVISLSALVILAALSVLVAVFVKRKRRGS